MTIKKLIDAALEGGWDGTRAFGYNAIYSNNQYNTEFIHEDMYPRMVIDPKMWECAGKTLGWKGESNCNNCGGDCWCWCDRFYTESIPRHLHYMHKMIDALAEGKTLEEYIETL